MRQNYAHSTSNKPEMKCDGTPNVKGSSCFADQKGREARMARAISQLVLEGYEVERGTISFEQVASVRR
jgi:hypothetical protein